MAEPSETKTRINNAERFFEEKLYEKANEEYRQAEAAGPLSAQDYSNWGVVWAKLKRDPEAIEKYKTALAIDKGNADAHSNLANVWVRKGDNESDAQAREKTLELAVREYQEALGHNPKHSNARAGLVSVFFKLGRYEEADKELEIAIQQDPKNADNYFNRGIALANSKDPRGAIEQYRKAIEHRPDYAAAWNNWGNFLYQQGDYQQAAENFSHASGSKDSTPLNYNNFGLALLKLGQPENAKTQFERALNANPPYAPARAGLAEALLALGRVRESQSVFLQVMQFDPFSVNYAKWVRALGQLGSDRPAAEAAGRQAIAQAPADVKKPHPAGAYNLWGQALATKFKFSEAMEKYEKAKDLLSGADPKNQLWARDLADAYMNQGWVLMSQFKRPEAIARFEEAKGAAPNYPQTFTALASALAENKQFEDALGACDQAFAVDEDSSWKYYILWVQGNILTASGRGQEGMRKHAESASANPDFPYSRHNIAAELLKEGRYAEARRAYEKALPVYARAVESYRNDENADFFGYYGGVFAEVLSDFEKAEDIFKMGLSLNPSHPDILMRLTNLYLAKRGMGTPEEGAVEYWKARECYAKATEALKQWRDAAGDWLTELNLGQLDSAFERHDQAEEHLLAARRLNPDALEPISQLGALYFNQDNFADAERCFQEVLKRDPDNLTAASSLADVCRSTNKLVKALEKHKTVLKKAPDQLDSLIGLAQVYLSLADEGDYAMYEQSIRQFDLALRRGESGDASRSLRDKDRATIYYLRGYAKSQQYSKAKFSRQRRSLLFEAKKDFEACGPDHYRAKLAVQRIDEKFKDAVPGFLEQWGPGLIVIVSFGVLVLAQLSFYFGMFASPVDEPGAYSGITFGAIGLMIAGFFLPLLTKLKVAGVELEKEVIDQVAIASPLDISRSQGDSAGGVSTRASKGESHETFSPRG